MADFCADCTEYEVGGRAMHDLPEQRGWYLCEGCGYHIFAKGLRICRAGTIPIEEVEIGPCEMCATYVGTDEAP